MFGQDFQGLSRLHVRHTQSPVNRSFFQQLQDAASGHANGKQFASALTSDAVHEAAGAYSCSGNHASRDMKYVAEGCTLESKHECNV